MHTLELASNSITWKVEVKGEIAFWPDIADTYEIEVRPNPID